MTGKLTALKLKLFFLIQLLHKEKVFQNVSLGKEKKLHFALVSENQSDQSNLLW